MEQEKIDRLYAPLTLHSRPGKGGRTFKYVKGEDVIDRMNKVFEGKWSATTIYQDIVGEEAVVRVQVSIMDDNTFYHQDGFGSSAITAGSVGDGYKSALTKAIKNACSKWGLGLYLEEGAPAEVSSAPPIPSKPATMPSRAPASMPNIPNVPKEEPTPEPEPVVVENTPPSAPKMPKIPPFAKAEAPKEEAPKAAPVAEEKPAAFPKIPMPPKASAAPAGASERNKDNISDVQKAAVKGLVTIRGLDYNKLVTDAFTDKGIEFSKIPEADDLSYEQAVVVIKYGNDLFKNK